VREIALALLDRELAVDLLHLLRDSVAEDRLAELGDRLNRLRALARAGAGAGGVTVVAVAVGHAIIITSSRVGCKPLDRVFVSFGVTSTYGLWITRGKIVRFR
jgi:hypothetical protein